MCLTVIIPLTVQLIEPLVEYNYIIPEFPNSEKIVLFLAKYAKIYMRTNIYVYSTGVVELNGYQGSRCGRGILVGVSSR